jgi:hypothetical protein
MVVHRGGGIEVRESMGAPLPFVRPHTPLHKYFSGVRPEKNKVS